MAQSDSLTSSDMNDSGQPSQLALHHEREIATIRTGLSNLNNRLEGNEQWLKKVEGKIEAMGDDIRRQLAGMTQRNPMVYVGIAGLSVTIIGAASAVTLFAITSMVTPVREHLHNQSVHMDQLSEKVAKDHDLLIRLDEREKLRDKASVD